MADRSDLFFKKLIVEFNNIEKKAYSKSGASPIKFISKTNRPDGLSRSPDPHFPVLDVFDAMFLREYKLPILDVALVTSYIEHIAQGMKSSKLFKVGYIDNNLKMEVTRVHFEFTVPAKMKLPRVPNVVIKTHTLQEFSLICFVDFCPIYEVVGSPVEDEGPDLRPHHPDDQDIWDDSYDDNPYAPYPDQEYLNMQFDDEVRRLRDDVDPVIRSVLQWADRDWPDKPSVSTRGIDFDLESADHDPEDGSFTLSYTCPRCNWDDGEALIMEALFDKAFKQRKWTLQELYCDGQECTLTLSI
jgi:hypothetical protein